MIGQPSFIESMRFEPQFQADTYQNLGVAPLNGALGAEISGIDLSTPLSEQVLAELKLALLNHLVLVFRDQTILPGDLVSLGEKFGKLHINPFVQGVDGHPEIMPVRSAENNEKRFTGLWHSDTTWEEEPSMGSLLYAVRLPALGGDTLFSNMYLAYDTLDPETKEQLENLQATHMVYRHHSAKAEHADARDRVSHPVIRTHPETGRKLLFVNEYFTASIDGLSADESHALLAKLYSHLSRPDFSCRIRWAENTMVFWDNRCTQHYATNDYRGFAREMHRVTIIGDRPY